MVCRLQELDGANVPHGLGVAWGILLVCHGLFPWSKKLGFKKNSPRQKSYVGIRKKHTAFPPIDTHHKKLTINHGTAPRGVAAVRRRCGGGAAAVRHDGNGASVDVSSGTGAGGAGAGGGGGDARFAGITSWSGRGCVGSCCMLLALAGAGGGSGSCTIRGGGAALVSLGVGVGPLTSRLALCVRGAGGCWRQWQQWLQRRHGGGGGRHSFGSAHVRVGPLMRRLALSACGAGAAAAPA
jgi:hypothetical protein